MKYTGLNKLLYQRRKELRYSLKEASIKLGITKIKLRLIEQGYIKVKNKELQDLIIYKYKLDDDFFTKDTLEYPTIIENPPLEGLENSKPFKVFTSLAFKLSTLALCIGFTGMCIGGVINTRAATDNPGSFYSSEVVALKNHVVQNGVKHDHLNPEGLLFPSVTPTLVNEDYYAIEDVVSVESLVKEKYFWFTSINFFQDDNNLSCTFLRGASIIGTEEVPYYPEVGNVTYLCYFETRVYFGEYRTHFYAYEYYDKIDFGSEIVHLSVDHNFENTNFTYNLIEADPYHVGNILNRVDPNSFEGFMYTTLFRFQNLEFQNSINELFTKRSADFKVDAKTFVQGIANGSTAYANRINTYYSLITWGSILGIVFFAICGLSFLTGFSGKEKIKEFGNSDVDYTARIKEEKEKKREFKPLPKNWLPAPFVPEFLVRIFAIAVALLSSFGLFAIFQSINTINPVGMINSMSFKSEISAFSTLAVLLLLFVKLDMKQQQKDTFLGNYFLFFFGLIFYVLLILVQQGFAGSNSIVAIAANTAMSFLPGNIIWGILAFNLLSSFLFAEPDYIKGNKKRTLVYRLCSILPIAYMVGSVVVQVGQNAGNWEVPFAVNSLFFSKALFLTAFTVLYCFGVFMYRKIVVKKFGKENASIYEVGNRYYYIKNLVICFIVALLGVIDLVISKCWANNPIGAGGNYVILFAIPFILLYHPHHGERNMKWDLGFILLYGLSMALGIILIASSVSVYVNAL